MRLLLLPLLSLALLVGCPKHPEPIVVHQGQDYRTFETANGGKVLFDIPVKTDDEVIPPQGWSGPDILTFTIPGPDDIKKVVFVRPKKKTIASIIFPKKDEPKWEVVSNDPEVIPAQPETTPWWWFALGGTGIFLAGWLALSRIFASITGPLKLIMKLFGR